MQRFSFEFDISSSKKFDIFDIYCPKDNKHSFLCAFYGVNSILCSFYCVPSVLCAFYYFTSILFQQCFTTTYTINGLTRLFTGCMPQSVRGSFIYSVAVKVKCTVNLNTCTCLYITQKFEIHSC